MTMKKFILFILLLIYFEGHSQITLSFQTSSPNYLCFKLSDTETKFFDYDLNKINSLHHLSLYNVDGTLFKSIQLPVDPSTGIFRIEWISRTLFDNDPSNIEYLLCYQKDSSYYTQSRTKVLREDGTVLLDELNASLQFFYGLGYWMPVILSTESGTKLKLEYLWAGGGTYYQSKVFNLPGSIPTGTFDNLQGINGGQSLYPNPNNGSFFIKLNKHDGKSYMIDLYTTNGILIDTFKSSDNPAHVVTNGLSEGVYLINTHNENLNSSNKVIIKQ